MTTLREVLSDAQRRRVAVGHFNFSDLTVLRAAAEGARELGLPVMVGLSEGEREFVGVRQAAALVRTLRDGDGLPVFLNADHTHSIAKAEEAARAGFDEIIFDRSELPFEANVAETRRAVEAIRSIDPAIVIEGEIGYIGSSSAILAKTPARMDAPTTPEQARQFVAETGIDVLAPAVGNMHGMLQSMVSGEVKKRLDIERIGELARASGVFMTLHGGSGTADDDFRRAIRAGITIVHVNTEIRIAWRRGLEAALRRDPDEVAPYRILPGALESAKDVIVKRLRLFNFI